jgi:hypothetical protein
MTGPMRDSHRKVLKFSALSLGLWIAAHPLTAGEHEGSGVNHGARTCRACREGRHAAAVPAAGTVGYGPPGVYAGFQGFGLGYHPGYGYGGNALGVGAEGGYPFYGGPGYPHVSPRLRRLKRIVPFPYFGGPGFPDPMHPNFFEPFGALAPDKPVVTIENQGSDQGGYGSYSGALPDPEARFAPFATDTARTTREKPGLPSPPPSDRSPAMEAREP